MSETTKLEYLLNAMQCAADQVIPADHDYFAKRKAVLDYVAETEHSLALERSVWCDKPEDRLYHASDGTWWRRDGRGQCVAAEAPGCVAEEKQP